MSEASDEMIRRREILKRVAWILGGAVSAPAALAFLQGCSARDAAPAGAPWTPKFFTGSQAEVVAAIADIMIPRTDTSGALDAGVPAFIDLMMADVYPQDAQARFVAGCAQFEAAAAATGQSFMEQAPAARVDRVKQSLEAALQGEFEHKPFILFVRELTLLGYYSSRVGITENMEYVAVPTAYHGCVPLSKMGKPVQWE